MYLFLISLHVLVSLMLVTVVLMQAGKGGGLAGAFGGPGGAGQSFFGGQGAVSFLSKATVALGVVFFISSITLAMMTAQRQSAPSLIQQEAQQGQVAPPPAATPTQGAPAGGAPAGTPAGTPDGAAGDAQGTGGAAPSGDGTEGSSDN